MIFTNSHQLVCKEPGSHLGTIFHSFYFHFAEKSLYDRWKNAKIQAESPTLLAGTRPKSLLITYTWFMQKGKSYLKLLLLAFIILGFNSCSTTGSIPSVAGFMNPKDELNILQSTFKGGELQDNDGYEESPVYMDGGIFIGFRDFLRFGVEAGIGDSKLIAGINSDYFGALAWLAAPTSSLASITYGAALAAQYPIYYENYIVSFGTYPFINKLYTYTYNREDYIGLRDVGARSHYVTGMGTYMSVQTSGKINLGLSFDGQIARRVKTHEITHQFGFSIFASFDKKEKSAATIQQ